MKATPRIGFTNLTGFQSLKLALFGAGSGAAALGGYLFNPSHYRYGPSCPFHSATGLYCPICGSTRAVYQLLHLNLIGAIQDNLLLVLALPVLVWAWIGWAKAFAGIGGWRGLSLTPRRGAILVVVVLTFAVLRNLPGTPFSWFTPVN